MNPWCGVFSDIPNLLLRRRRFRGFMDICGGGAKCRSLAHDMPWLLVGSRLRRVPKKVVSRLHVVRVLLVTLPHGCWCGNAHR